MTIDIERTLTALRTTHEIEVPLGFGPLAEIVSATLRAQHECLLEILGELRAVNARTNAAALGNTVGPGSGGGTL